MNKGLYHRSYQPAPALVIERALGVTPNLWVKFLCRNRKGQYCTLSVPEKDTWFDVVNRYPQKCSVSDLTPWYSAEFKRHSGRVWSVFTDRNFSNVLACLSPSTQNAVLREMRDSLTDDDAVEFVKRFGRRFLTWELLPFSFNVDFL